MSTMTVEATDRRITGTIGLGDVAGFVGSSGDWIGTVGIVGITPYLLSRAGDGEWMPRWLVRLGMVALAAGGLAVVGLYAGQVATIGIPVVLAGLAWFIGAGIVLTRRT